MDKRSDEKGFPNLSEKLTVIHQYTANALCRGVRVDKRSDEKVFPNPSKKLTIRHQYTANALCRGVRVDKRSDEKVFPNLSEKLTVRHQYTVKAFTENKKDFKFLGRGCGGDILFKEGHHRINAYRKRKSF